MNYFQSFDSEKIAYQIKSNQASADLTNAIVIAHGIGGDLNFLEKFIDRLSKNLHSRPIVSFNLRGHGLSSAHFPATHDKIETVYAKDLQALIVHLKIKKPIFIGHCLGGMVMQEYLNLDFKPKPEKLFLICSMTQTLGIPALRNIFYKILRKSSPNSIRPKNVYKSFYDNLLDSHDLNPVRIYHDTKLVGGIKMWILHYLSVLGWKNTRLENIDKKSYFYIYGKKDIINPEILQKIRLKKLTNINKIALNSGHIAPMSNYQELADEISKKL